MQLTIKYFAYGSNMHPLRMQLRVPSCRFVGLAQLQGYRLAFHKRSRDGSGKCNVHVSDNADDRVQGVVYEMDADEKVLLDRAEGLGQGYDATTLTVRSGKIEHRVFLYVADGSYIDDSLRPYTWYKALVVAGAHHHRLPPSYVKHIESVATVEDLDTDRAGQSFAILNGGPFRRVERS